MPEKVTVEDSFRESLKDVVAITTKMTPYCTTFEELNQILNLAMENDAQLKLVMNIVTAQTKVR